jgi:hypothetical protein
LFSNLTLILLIFILDPFVNFIFLFNSPFNSKLYVVLLFIFYFKFDPHSFNCYFYFESFCIIDFFFILKLLICWELGFVVFSNRVLMV